MNSEQLRIMAMILATQAAIEGMKADNAKAENCGNSPVWTSDHFNGAQGDLYRLAEQAAQS